MTLFGYILTSNMAGTAWENQASFLREWDVRSPACREALGTPKDPGGQTGRRGGPQTAKPRTIGGIKGRY